MKAQANLRPAKYCGPKTTPDQIIHSRRQYLLARILQATYQDECSIQSSGAPKYPRAPTVVEVNCLGAFCLPNSLCYLPERQQAARSPRRTQVHLGPTIADVLARNGRWSGCESSSEGRVAPARESLTQTLPDPPSKSYQIPPRPCLQPRPHTPQPVGRPVQYDDNSLRRGEVGV